MLPHFCNIFRYLNSQPVNDIEKKKQIKNIFTGCNSDRVDYTAAIVEVV